MQNEMMRLQQNTRLSDLCSDCFMLILQLRAAKEFGDAEVFRRRVKELFNKLERDGRRAGISIEDISIAKFAMVAFIDESVVTSDWSQRTVWLSNPLQRELFDRLDAGEEFFRRVDQLRQRSHEYAQVLEVYYLCMALGFKGRYQLHEQEKLRILIDDLHSELRRLADSSTNVLSPHGKRKEEIVEVVAKEIPVWIVGVAAAAIGFFFYLIMTFLISGAADDVAELLK